VLRDWDLNVENLPVKSADGPHPAGRTAAAYQRHVPDSSESGPDGLPALVHCTAGKDRTGLVIALALGAVGVEDASIAEDYALSSQYLVGAYFDDARERALRRGIPWETYRANLVCPAPLMLETLETMRARYGSVADYLLDYGFSAAEQDELRERLTE
jgi:protein-tyrosine phosphatase